MCFFFFYFVPGILQEFLIGHLREPFFENLPRNYSGFLLKFFLCFFQELKEYYKIFFLRGIPSTISIDILSGIPSGVLEILQKLFPRFLKNFLPNSLQKF